jgi:hypothetical protein
MINTSHEAQEVQLQRRLRIQCVVVQKLKATGHTKKKISQRREERKASASSFLTGL